MRPSRFVGAASALGGSTILPCQAFAHSAERGFILLLPTGHVIAGGTLAVASSFLIMILVSDEKLLRFFAKSKCLGCVPMLPPTATSMMSAAFLALLIWAGFSGSRDPLANPLPLTIWTVWWVGIVLVHPIVGNAWAWLNPFAGLHRLAAGDRRPPFVLPDWFSYVPAIPVFLAFAWFQLVYPAPEDPEKLAIVVLTYSVLTFLAVCLFGPTAWLSRADPFAAFLRFLALLSVFSRDSPKNDTLILRMPGARLAESAPIPVAGVIFVLLTLSSVSFDAFSSTFWWLSLGGVNPLDFPGRSGVMELNSWGVAGAFLVLSILFFSAIFAGWVLSGRPMSFLALLGRFVLALIPISIAFHFAHYLTDILINGQYVLLAIDDL